MPNQIGGNAQKQKKEMRFVGNPRASQDSKVLFMNVISNLVLLFPRPMKATGEVYPSEDPNGRTRNPQNMPHLRVMGKATVPAVKTTKAGQHCAEVRN
jgi:hypothetical protein